MKCDFFCFVLDQETFVISIKILDFISKTTATAATAKNAWTEFVLKISKSHHLSQNRNSCIFCLLRKGTGPEGSICIIEIALRCHKQRCSRTDVNGIKILQLIFLMSHHSPPPPPTHTFDVSHLFIEGKVGRGKIQKQILVILS